MRKKIALWLVRLARKVYPESPAVQKFMEDYLLSMAIEGQACIHVPGNKWRDLCDGKPKEKKA